VALEDRAAGLEREREQRARAAVVVERARIARDLHDVIAHSVTVMTIQAGAARLLLPAEPERARDAALSVEETGRQALAEMRRLLGVLRADEGAPARTPQPGMADLDELLGRMRRPGVRVQVELEGAPDVLPPGLDLAAYRIVEEALGHALEHGNASWARVTARYGRERLDLEIANDGRGPSDSDGGADCLVAMRELVALYGGELEAGRRAGGYAVRARLPLAPSWSASSSSAAAAVP
jgi:signal transduction histidine kinase